MEQTVWLYVGIIAALIGLGFVASIVVSSNETNKQQAVENSIRKMEQNCNLVCGSDPETMFSVDVTMVGGMKLYSQGNSICADYGGNTGCKQCDCSIFSKPSGEESIPTKPFELDLSTPEARLLFDTHVYNCFMERFEEGVAVECKG